MSDIEISRGDVFYGDLNPVVGSEQGGIRPVLIIQNDIGNKYSPTVIVAAITSEIDKTKLPTHVSIKGDSEELRKDSIVLLEQIRTIDKDRLKQRVTQLPEETMSEVDKAISISLGLIKL